MKLNINLSDCLGYFYQEEGLIKRFTYTVSHRFHRRSRLAVVLVVKPSNEFVHHPQQWEVQTNLMTAKDLSDARRILQTKRYKGVLVDA
jgi:hypothetical protein